MTNLTSQRGDLTHIPFLTASAQVSKWQLSGKSSNRLSAGSTHIPLRMESNQKVPAKNVCCTATAPLWLGLPGDVGLFVLEMYGHEDGEA